MNDFLICNYKECNKYLEKPVILPCSNIICMSHFDELNQNNNEKKFNCFVCNNEHKILNHKLSFLNSKALKIIDYNLNLNEKKYKIDKSLSELTEEIEQLDDMIRDPENFIFEYFATIRNKIDLERERLISEINDLSEDMLDKLKKCEEECKQNLEQLNATREKKRSYLQTSKNKILKLKEELKFPKNNYDEIDQLFEQSNKLIKDIESKHLDYQNRLTLQNNYSFNGKGIKFDENLFGYLSITNLDTNLDETCLRDNLNTQILTRRQSKDLIKLCEFDDAQIKFKLIYSATKDGFSAENFHSKCDGIPNTLTIIKVKGNSNVFGGFCSVTWDTSSGGKYDSKAFIFSLLNKDNRQLKINVTNPSKAINCFGNYGPMFAEDIVISSNSNENQESYSNLGNNYRNVLYRNETIEAMIYLAGSFFFSTEEIEVYQVLYKNV